MIRNTQRTLTQTTTMIALGLALLLAGGALAEPPSEHPRTNDPGWTIFRDVYKERAEAREEERRRAQEPVVLTPEQQEMDRQVLEEIAEQAKYQTPNPIFIEEQAHRALEILAEADPELVPSMGPGGELWEAIERYRRTGEAVVVKQSGAVVYPFGESQPVVRCSTARAGCSAWPRPATARSASVLGRCLRPPTWPDCAPRSCAAPRSTRSSPPRSPATADGPAATSGEHS